MMLEIANAEREPRSDEVCMDIGTFGINVPCCTNELL